MKASNNKPTKTSTHEELLTENKCLKKIRSTKLKNVYKNVEILMGFHNYGIESSKISANPQRI